MKVKTIKIKICRKNLVSIATKYDATCRVDGERRGRKRIYYSNPDSLII
jgi:hypothetical protein